MNKNLMLAAFAVLLTGFAFASTMDNATGAYQINQSGFADATGHANHTTEGGNVTFLNLDQNSSTDQWAGYVGDVTGALVLAQAGDSANLFRWVWTDENGTVCASTGGTFSFAAPAAATVADLVTGWANLATGSDSAANTFTTTGSVTINGASVGPAVAADTGPATGFATVAVTDGGVVGSDDIAFCVTMVAGSTDYHGNAADYELIVATPVSPTTEQYYFYLELF